MAPEFAVDTEWHLLHPDKSTLFDPLSSFFEYWAHE
jgi:hypothetical protein